jgi:hypothetical protein
VTVTLRRLSAVRDHVGRGGSRDAVPTAEADVFVAGDDEQLMHRRVARLLGERRGLPSKALDGPRS